MGNIDLKYTKNKETKGDIEYTYNTITNEEFEQFNVGLLDLGTITQKSYVKNALVAVIDLEGFTDFCNQIDNHLVIPEFLSEFLTWLFKVMKDKFLKQKTKSNVHLWGSLPFFGKFTGDGALFLWDTDLSVGMTGIGNIALNMESICNDYKFKLYPLLSKSFAKMPVRLRVGIARGQVLSIGGGNDFVGPCINLASRLQKISSLSFAISRRGFDPEECFKEYASDYIVKKIPIQGISNDEPILILETHYDALSPEEKKQFR
ncbi:MAG: hypothetical protein ISR97_03415 [Nitrospira sp.]|nr:hypothetical protein [Nitrospira sp.]